ncbi:MAG: glycosyltransferase family 2 protein [Pyrinomonadaceae bacterium]|nr:glycosyltransferase family 2 protein [Pyrinomonadaceae bacterium]MCX7639564.1 glycosyltransferase family 2 protein [Pyrinomonadaceae bacterium]MDW8303957.1 glycosyltransferase family 2 protein [Acidobacteriota bacterium]
MTEVAFLVFAVSISILWLLGFLWTSYTILSQKPLEPELDEVITTEFVSVVVPARNEANRVLEKSISSMLSQDYKSFEVIVVNDRSTDGTGEILQELAKRDSKLKIIDGKETESGWLGKPFALQQGFEKARGDWVLITDADIIFSPYTVKTSVKFAKENNLDALTLLPRIVHGSFWETLFMPVFGWFCLLAMPPQYVNDPNRKESMGIGNFFLFRKGVLDELGGFVLVKDEVAEDLKMAEILKRSGFKMRLEYAPNLIETRMYSSLKEIWEGFTKNLFSGVKFSFVKSAISCVFILLFGVLPIVFAVLFLLMGSYALAFWFFLIYFFQVLTFAVIHLKWQGNILYAFLTPLGLMLFLLILANSTVRIATGKGVTWKGRKIYEKGGVRPPVLR